ncbi:MAG: hypothetical protein KAT58_10180 [candidate division Zixibacteria bacterium]|nr:hypothetical protein [candidate division Zixibacteria bacterium]
MSSKWIRRLALPPILLVILYLVLLIPAPAPPTPAMGVRTPFVWGQDDYWSVLEDRFRQARRIGCDDLSDSLNKGLLELDSLVRAVDQVSLDPTAAVFTQLEAAFFETGILVAACPQGLPEYLRAFGNLRRSIKDQSLRWDLQSPAAVDCLYKLLYGGRTAVEEAMLQAAAGSIAELAVESEEPSQTPAAVAYGVEIHSGDILISRGGAPTSALIARGSNYPGNFSHSALVHIDDATGVISIIEAHIECGVTVSTIEDYLNDTKLRIMVLRPRADLPELNADPLLPHRVASYALGQAKSRHTPYDFAMDTEDHSLLFCSEVVSAAYEQFGVDLWRKASHISEPGLRSWLSAFGVRYFTTQEPSDLEYDPQLRVVAEWRDSEALRQDHLDNAIVDVMLEGARRGDRLEYSWFMLPVARVVKLYSVVLNLFGEVGLIPEGMSPTAALQHQWLGKQHQLAKTELSVRVAEFEHTNGYTPPYWELVKMAREVYAHDLPSLNRSSF